MNIVLLGPPASGKGTCSEYLEKKCNMTHISMGDLLRKAAKGNSRNAQIINEVISQGKILSEDITADILQQHLAKIGLYDNILLDGYPRGMISVELMKKFLKIDLVIVLEASLEEIKKRVLNRLICPKCKSVYSKLNGATVCDKCQTKLVTRNDDTEGVLLTRMDEYQKFTMPVIEYYQKLGIVKFVDSQKDIYRQLDVIINKMC